MALIAGLGLVSVIAGWIRHGLDLVVLRGWLDLMGVRKGTVGVGLKQD